MADEGDSEESLMPPEVVGFGVLLIVSLIGLGLIRLFRV